MGFLKRDTPIVVIDDDTDGQQRLTTILGEDGGGASVMAFADPAEALANLPVDVTVVVLCEQNLSGTSGLEWMPDMVRAVRGPVILMSSDPDASLATQAFRQGASDFLDKGEMLQAPERLYKAIREALRRHNLRRQSGDLTRRLKLTTGKLERRNERLNQHIVDTHRFVENVAHDFRTPLTVIQEYAALMMEQAEAGPGELPSTCLGHIMSTTRDLAELVDDLLDSSRVRTRSLRVDRRVYTAAQLFEAARPLLVTRARSKNIQITEQIDGTCEVFCDLQKAKRIIINLVINAIKYSPHASTVCLHAEATGGHDVRIAVSDSGPGLSAGDMAQLGERFRQFGQVTAPHPKGYGLGLNIAKELIWLNLGRLEVRSNQGAGSTFSFTLPNPDPEHAVRRVIDLLGTDFDPLHMTVIHASTGGGPEESSRLRTFLAAHCHPMDLILDTMNDNGIVLVGMTAEPDHWIHRLQTAHAAVAGTDNAFSSGPINLRWLGTWSGHELPDAVAKAALDRVIGLRACA